MGLCNEVIIGYATNPGATITAVTMGTGNSNQVRAFNPQSRAWLENIWMQGATAGVGRVRSAKMHDAVQGLRVRNVAAIVRSLMDKDQATRMYSTDTLTIEASGGGAEVDAIALNMFYEDLDGSNARLATWEQIKPAVVDLLTVEVAVTGPTTAGDWSAGNALNSFVDLLKADTRYAVFGYICDTESLAVALSGPDTGNYRTGGPGCIEVVETRDWFVRESIHSGRAHIPVINSNNRAGTMVSVANVAAGGTINVDLLMAELSGV